MSKPLLSGDRSLIGSVKELVVYGDSLPAGGGVSDPTKDIMTRFASMIGAQEVNWAAGGSVLFWPNDVTNNEWGTVGHVLQTHKRPNRAASTLNAGTAAGGTITSIVITHGSTTTPLDSATGIAFKVNDIVHVGDGLTGELAVVNGITRGTTTSTLSLKAFEGWSFGVGGTGLIRAHTAGDPVFVVPSHFTAGNTVYFLCEVHNMLAHVGLHNANWDTWFRGALRTCLARLRCAEIFEPDHSAIKFSGSTGSLVGNNALGSGDGTNQGLRGGFALNGAVEFHIPDNFPGGTAVLAFASSSDTGTGTWTFTIDGVAAGTMSTLIAPGTAEGPRAKTVNYVKRFTGLAAGRHKIVAQLTTAPSAGSPYFDWAGLEAQEPPVVVVFKPPRFYQYALYSSSYKYGHQRALIAANRTAGDTFVTVNQGVTPSWRQFTAGSIPAVGEYVRIGVGGVNEETKIVSSVTGASAPFTINFSAASPGGSGLVNAHTTTEYVEIGIKDSDLRPDPTTSRPTVSAQIDTLLSEFDGYVVDFDPDTALNGDAAANTTNPANKDRTKSFVGDLIHPNEIGHAAMAQALYDQLIVESRIGSRLLSRYSRPSLPAVGFRDILVADTAVVWTAMPAAVTELFGNLKYRFKADLSNATYARIQVTQAAVALAGAKLRLQYLDEDGVTWRHLGRRHILAYDGYSVWSDFTEPTTAAQINGVEVGLSTVVGPALIDGGWWPIYPTARRECTLRIVGIGGNGTAAPSFHSIRVDWRR